METALLSGALGIAFQLSIPIVLAALIAGFIGGVLRAATQVDDAIISFAAKLSGVSLVLFVGAGFFSGQLSEYARQLWGGLNYYH